MIGQHVRMRLRDDGSLADTPARRRLVAATVLRQGASFGLVAFGIADTHGHLVIAGSDRGHELARRIAISLALRLRLEVGFARVRVKDLADQWHLYRAFEYALAQQRRHAVLVDPLHDASNLADLLGARLAGAYTAANVRRWLPRIRRADLLRLLGVDDLAPAGEPLEWLPAASAAAACLPDLGGRSPAVVAARRALVEVAGARARAAYLAELMGVHRATIPRLRRPPAEAALVQAVRLQLGLRRVLTARSVLPPAGAFGNGDA